MQNYLKIPMTIICYPGLSQAAKLLYGMIAVLCSKKGYCWATNAFLSERLGVSRRSIIRCLSELQEAKLLDCSYVQDSEDRRAKRQLRLLSGEEDRARPKEETGSSVALETGEKTVTGASSGNVAEPDTHPEESGGLSGQPGNSPFLSATDPAMAQVSRWLESTCGHWPEQQLSPVKQNIGEFLLRQQRMGNPISPGPAVSALCQRLARLSGGNPKEMAEILSDVMLDGGHHAGAGKPSLPAVPADKPSPQVGWW